MVKSSRLYLGELNDETPTIRIGQFELEECIGEGSMGEVWRGRHSVQDVEVAVKVIVSEQAMNERFQRAFRQEVRSVAGLNHPFVVDVFDYGTIDERAEDASVARFTAGSPYLAMEYARYGSLAGMLNGPASWGATRLVLFALLDVLAHCHARGVIHRDIKPQNVLLTETGGRPGIRLSDYGLAYALREAQEVPNWHRAAGTPEYMAPEQLTGDWRKYGPAMDLYAAGCLAYEMLTGRVPFCGNNMVQTAKRHLEEPLPRLPEECDAPKEMQQWLNLLLAKDSSDRFRSAAEAARTLRQFSGGFDEEQMRRDWASIVSTSGTAAVSSEQQGARTLMPVHSLSVVLGQAAGDEVVEEKWDGMRGAMEEVPSEWRRSIPVTQTRRLGGTGRGLFGLRRLPMLGREEERAHLWSRFRECAREKKVGVTLLSGPAGVGKDYLAEWICERAGELGVAQVLRAFHESSAELIDGVIRMIKREFFLDGLSRPEIEAFFKSLLSGLGVQERYDWESMTELIRPAESHGSSSPRIHFSVPNERHLAVVRFLEHLSRRGPLLLWINDVQWGVTALRFVRILLAQIDIKVPIYIVMTIRDDLLVEGGDHCTELDAILKSNEAERLEIEPLDETTIRDLVEEALFLDPLAAYEVARRSGGNPLHALEIVGEWLERDMLKSSPRGYVFGDGVEPGPAGKWMEMWSGVIDRLVEESVEGRRTLELGAILGERIDLRTWETAAGFIGTDLCEEVIEAVLERKYVIKTAQGLVFAQNLLREALFASARKNGRWEEMCRACARALDACVSDGQNIDERVGFLLLEAKEQIEGGRRLCRAAEVRRSGREYHAMIHLATRGEAALQSNSSPEATMLRMKMLEISSHGWHMVGDNDKALQFAQQLGTLAEHLENRSWVGVARFREVAPVYHIGRIDEARRAGGEALERLGVGYEEQYAMTCMMLTHVELRQGNHDTAMARIEKAHEVINAVNAPIESCNIDYVWLKTRVICGEEVSREEIEKLIERSRNLGVKSGEAACCNLRAEIARREGDLSDAMVWYKRSVKVRSQIDRDGAVPARLNFALVAIEQGDVVAGGLMAKRILQGLKRMTRPQMKLYSKVIMLPMLAARGDYEELESLFTSVAVSSEELGVSSDRDIAFCLHKVLEILKEDKPQSALYEKIKSALTSVLD